jgi:Tfp pilus assembly protein PilO
MSLAHRIFSEKRQLIYPLVGALILNAAVYGAVVYPLSLKVANGERDASAAAAARATGKAEFEAARATVTGKDAANRELKKFYGDVLPPDQSAARRIIRAKIEELTNASNVKLLQESFDPKRERDSDLGKLTATVLLMGEYRGIRRLIYGLETAPEFLILENVALSQVQERDQALNLTVKIATYYRAD